MQDDLAALPTTFGARLAVRLGTAGDAADLGVSSTQIAIQTRVADPDQALGLLLLFFLAEPIVKALHHARQERAALTAGGGGKQAEMFLPQALGGAREAEEA